MLCKYGRQTCDFWGIFSFTLVYFFYILRAFLIKQLFHSRLLDMRLVIANSYPTRAHGIIVKYHCKGFGSYRHVGHLVTIIRGEFRDFFPEK